MNLDLIRVKHGRYPLPSVLGSRQYSAICVDIRPHYGQYGRDKNAAIWFHYFFDVNPFSALTICGIVAFVGDVALGVPLVDTLSFIQINRCM